MDLFALADDVIKHADIVKVVGSYLTLVKKGKNYMAVCPFHDDSNPSLCVSPEKQLFKCFVCGVGGSAISFVEKYEHISFKEAIRKVAEISDYHPQGLEQYTTVRKVDERKEAILKCLHDLNLFYEFALQTPEGKVGLEYLDSRDLNADFRNKYKLGYAYKDGKATIEFLKKKGHSLKTIEDCGIAKIIGGSTYVDMNEGRVTFPICDADGNVIGFSARIFVKSDEPKYMNTPETYLFHKTSNLYNLHIAKNAAKQKGYIYVCEGFMDVFALAKVGIDAAVAIMGTALTKEHIAILRSLNVELRICLDGDLPGQTAMLKIANALSKEGINFRLVDNQGSDRDPDEIYNEDGKEALLAYVNKLINKFDFMLNYYTLSNPLKTTQEKEKLITDFAPVLAKITSTLEQDNYIRKIAKVTGYEVETIRSFINKTSVVVDDDQNYQKIIKNYHPERKALRKLINAEKELLFQMLDNETAIKFYEDKIVSFYDDIYRQIANYLIEYNSRYHDTNLTGVMLMIENSEDTNKEILINDLLQLDEEDYHPANCSEELLNNLEQTIKEEKVRINEEDDLAESLVGKDELEKARIIAEHNRRKTMNK